MPTIAAKQRHWRLLDSKASKNRLGAHTTGRPYKLLRILSTTDGSQSNLKHIAESVDEIDMQFPEPTPQSLQYGWNKNFIMLDTNLLDGIGRFI